MTSPEVSLPGLRSWILLTNLGFSAVNEPRRRHRHGLVPVLALLDLLSASLGHPATPAALWAADCPAAAVAPLNRPSSGRSNIPSRARRARVRAQQDQDGDAEMLLKQEHVQKCVRLGLRGENRSRGSDLGHHAHPLPA